MEVIRNKNAKQLAGRALVALFGEGESKPVLFLSSGGSVLGILDEVDKSVFGPNFTIGVLDERFSMDTAANNFLQLKGKLGQVAVQNWIDSVPKENDTLEFMVSRMEGCWHKWRSSNPSGGVIVTVGMGADGHVAGIFPYNNIPELSTMQPRRLHIARWVAGYDAGKATQFPLRITATFEFLRSQVDSAIIYISGDEKRQALERVLADNGNLIETPARIFREMKNVKIFTDIE